MIISKRRSLFSSFSFSLLSFILAVFFFILYGSPWSLYYAVRVAVISKKSTVRWGINLTGIRSALTEKSSRLQLRWKVEDMVEEVSVDGYSER